MKDKEEPKKLTLHERLVKIQQELKAPKSQYNSFGKYNYRNCEDILEAVKPLLEGCTLTLHDNIQQVGDRYYVVAKVVLSDGEDQIENVAFARESEIKTGMDSAQITGAASSYARKYALNGLFLIDDTRDPDTQDNTKIEASRPVSVPKVEGNVPLCPIHHTPFKFIRGKYGNFWSCQTKLADGTYCKKIPQDIVNF